VIGGLRRRNGPGHRPLDLIHDLHSGNPQSEFSESFELVLDGRYVGFSLSPSLRQPLADGPAMGMHRIANFVMASSLRAHRREKFLTDTPGEHFTVCVQSFGPGRSGVP